MKKKSQIPFLLVLTVFAILISSSFATVNFINDCGNFTYGTDGTPTWTINKSINITTSSTITKNACVYIKQSGNGGACTQTDILKSTGAVIINNINYTASNLTGIYIETSDGCSAATIAATGANITISNVAVGLAVNYTSGHVSAGTFPTDTSQLKFFNVSRPIQFTGGWTNAGLLTFKVKLLGCNWTYLPLINITYANATLDMTGSSINGSGCTLNVNSPTIYFNAGTIGNDYLWQSSNKLYYFNTILQNISINTSAGSVFTATPNNFSYSTTNLSSNSTVYVPSFEVYFNNATAFKPNETTSAISGVFMKEYYCVGGLCNPLYSDNTVSFPLYKNVPDTLSAVRFDQAYTTLKFWWVQGNQNYLIAWTKNNEDSYFNLQPNGQYIVEVGNGTNATNTTIINTCPSIYSICQILLSGNGTYSITPISNLNALWQDITYNITFAPASRYGVWSNQTTNLTFTIASANASLQYWGMQVDKYFNGTHSVFFLSNQTNASGGVVQVATNGTGRYVITTWFKSTNFRVYFPQKQTFYISNATGLASIAEKLSAGTLIDGWTYTLLALIITALVVGFISRYTFEGAGFVGLCIFTIFALLYPTAEVMAGVSIFTLDIIMGVMALAMFAVRQYY